MPLVYLLFCLCVFVSVCRSVRLSVCLLVGRSVCLSVCLCADMPTFLPDSLLSVSLSTSLAVILPVCVPACLHSCLIVCCLSVCLLVGRSVYLSICLSLLLCFCTLIPFLLTQEVIVAFILPKNARNLHFVFCLLANMCITNTLKSFLRSLANFRWQKEYKWIIGTTPRNLRISPNLFTAWVVSVPEISVKRLLRFICYLPGGRSVWEKVCLRS